LVLISNGFAKNSIPSGVAWVVRVSPISRGDYVVRRIASGLDVFIQDDSLLVLARLAIANLELLEVRVVPLAHERPPFG
jgi:hypothetical protein